MAYERKPSTILEFVENVPKTITLKTDPSKATSKQYTAKVSGKPYTKWTYFTTNGEVFWTFADLHKELQSFRAGDTVTITYTVPMGAKYGTYKVEGSGGTGMPVTTDLQMLAKENNNLIRMLIQRFDAFLNSQGLAGQIGVTPVSQPLNVPVQEAPREKSNTDLGF